jgi:SNF2 family DNA or RNA helicase
MAPELLDDVDFYDHQIDGVREMCRMRSIILADDMGLGKSLQALAAFIADIKMSGAPSTAVVICPTSLRDNWADEIDKFTTLPYMLLGQDINPKTGKLRTLTGAGRSLQIAEFASWIGTKILIMNYEQVKPHLVELNSLAIRVGIFDEAHYIKNHSSQRTKACLSLKDERSFLLTGTPLLNHVGELWPLLNKVAPSSFKSYHAFMNRYCVFGGWNNRQVMSVKNQKELQAILDKVMIRRLKKDVLDLPEVQYIQVKVDLHPKQRYLYDQIEEELRLESVDPGGIDTEVSNALTQFLRLKQICGTPFTLGFGDDSYKLDAVVARLLEKVDAGEKVVLFSQFRGVLEALRLRCMEVSILSLSLNGDVPVGERQALVKRWAAIPGGAVILCQSSVAGVGLNMTAAKVGFFVDKLFVPGLNQQCVDRMHRIGASTTQPVQIFEFIAKGTVESRVEAILRSKKITFDKVIGGTALMRKLLAALREKEEV